MDRLETELLKENSIIKFRQIFPPQVWLTATQEQRCCRVFPNLLTKSNVCKIMFVQQCSSTYADGTFQQSDFISSFHFLFHLNSPVTSDIVKGDGLGNAEAYEEDVGLQFDGSLLLLAELRAVVHSGHLWVGKGTHRVKVGAARSVPH